MVKRSRFMVLFLAAGLSLNGCAYLRAKKLQDEAAKRRQETADKVVETVVQALKNGDGCSAICVKLKALVAERLR